MSWILTFELLLISGFCASIFLWLPCFYVLIYRCAGQKIMLIIRKLGSQCFCERFARICASDLVIWLLGVRLSDLDFRVDGLLSSLCNSKYYRDTKQLHCWILAATSSQERNTYRIKRCVSNSGFMRSDRRPIISHMPPTQTSIVQFFQTWRSRHTRSPETETVWLYTRCPTKYRNAEVATNHSRMMGMRRALIYSDKSSARADVKRKFDQVFLMSCLWLYC